MWRTRLPSILAVLAVAALTFWAARTALADSPAGGAVPAFLEAQPSASEVPGQQSVTLTARLHSSAGVVGGAPVTQEFADDMGADGYGKDAVACVNLAKRLMGVPA